MEVMRTKIDVEINAEAKEGDDSDEREGTALEEWEEEAERTDEENHFKMDSSYSEDEEGREALAEGEGEERNEENENVFLLLQLFLFLCFSRFAMMPYFHYHDLELVWSFEASTGNC